jgi:hypothetical protein
MLALTLALIMTVSPNLQLMTAYAAPHPAASATIDNIAVTTFHNDNYRTGQNLHETILTTANVNAAHFGKRVSYPVDGLIYAQPLVVPNVLIKGKRYTVVYVATENDSVYAFDADQRRAVPPLWHTSFLHPPSVTAVPSIELYKKYPNKDITPQVGITGTPVIDPATGILYVVAFTKEHRQYVQRLHALDISTGREKPGSPITIQASVPGHGYDNDNGVVRFTAKTANQRAGLLLLDNVIYIAWGAFGDTDPYHGWLISYSYNGTRLQKVDASVYNDTPDGQEGGIWMGGTAPSVDTDGNIYLTTGNGTFDLNTGGHNAANSFIKLSSQNGLHLIDTFTPFNATCLDGRDEDLGSGGVLILPDQAGSDSHPHILIGGGKEGRIYLLDRESLGTFTANSAIQCNTNEEKRTDIDQVAQELPPGTTGLLFGSMSYWNGTATSGQFVYIGGFNDNLKAFQIDNGELATSPASRTSENFAFSGVTPSISSNGNADGTGIVWINSSSNCRKLPCTPTGLSVLHAYDATNLRKELYNSEQRPSRDHLASYVKFSVPTVANGKVFVGTHTSLAIYGLLS